MVRLRILVPVLVVLGGALPAQADLEARFRQFDRDGDGRLAPGELPYPRLFRRADANGDGFVTLGELQRIRLPNGGAPAPREEETPSDPPAAGPAIRAHRDLPYAEREGVDPRLLSLDLYTAEAKSETLRPVVVMIHGGGWRNGDKANAGMTQHKVPYFVGEGFVYASINYRLSSDPAVQHPAHVEDVACALAWLHDNVERYGGDPERLFVMGHSAGAHLAALVACDARRLAACGKNLSILKGVICLDTAAYDVPRYVHELGAGLVIRRMYERAFGATEAQWRDASPRHHVAEGKGIPPMLFFHTGERLAGATLSGEMVEALRKAGTPARAIHAHDRDHAGINRCIGLPGDPYTAEIRRFLADPAASNRRRKL